MANVIGEIPGRRSDIIVIGGHYDTKYFPGIRFVGANDGGSSAALLIELARSLVRTSKEYTIWIVFFDGEEERNPDSNRGASYGSHYMVNEMVKSGSVSRLRAAIVIDMIADRDLDIRRDSGSTSWINDILWGSARRLGYGAHFLDEAIPIEDDHVPFLRAGVPSALLIDYNYGSATGGRGFWHTPQDTIDKLSPKSLQVVGDVLLDSIRAIEAELDRGDRQGLRR
jgi:Zn-dependent M28 family amino/carboxypeptidase